jgi:hypothetical protein
MFLERLITIDDNGVRAETSISQAHYTWAAVTKADVTADFLILWSGTHPIAAIPRRAVGGADWNESLKWFQERIAHVA